MVKVLGARSQSIGYVRLKDCPIAVKSLPYSPQLVGIYAIICLMREGEISREVNFAFICKSSSIENLNNFQSDDAATWCARCAYLLSCIGLGSSGPSVEHDKRCAFLLPEGDVS